jgi:hypothetical protein
MDKSNGFSATLLPAIDAKLQWFDSEELPNLLEEYRLLHTCVKTLFELLVKKVLITPDPYKLDKKISDIVPPDDTPFNDNERQLVMGMRFSDYESMLDFLCNYFKFSVSHLTIDTIRKMVQLNNSFQWNSFSVNTPKQNTRTLATLLINARQNSEAITISMINDSILKAGKALNSINATLKDLTDFQREIYKGEIRKNVFEHPEFNAAKAFQNPGEEMAQIRKAFPAAMGKTPFYNDLIEEIVREDQTPNRALLQQALLDKLAVHCAKSAKKTAKVNTKDSLMEAVRILGAMSPQIEIVLQKMQENHDVLESEHNTFKDKLFKLLRKAFGIADNPVMYQVLVTDQMTETQHRELINYQLFAADIANRSRRYASIAVRNTSGYNKIESQTEEKILYYVTQQITECQKMLVMLNALDDFFKSAPQPQNRSRIKGLKMEITSLKNTVVKTNQRRAEYTAYVEEEAQMKKLGITDAE